MNILQGSTMEKIKEFCNEIKGVKYFSNNEAALEQIGVEYKIFPNRGAACDTARESVWEAAWCADRNAAWQAAWSAAWESAREAAWDAAWKAAWNKVRNVVREATHQDAAWEAAWSAALQCGMTSVCKDLDIPQEHRDYANKDWEIWKAGYGVLGKIEENVFYLYKRP